MVRPYRRYFDFSGRSRRLEYWMFSLFMVLVTLACILVMIAGIPFDQLQGNGDAIPAFRTPFWVGLGGIALFYLGSFIPGIAVTVRRFHDQDLSGWLYLLSFVPYVGGLIVFVFMCLDGTRGINRFGPDPKNPESDAEIFA